MHESRPPAAEGAKPLGPEGFNYILLVREEAGFASVQLHFLQLDDLPRLYKNFPISFWNPRNCLHRSLWGSLSDQRPLGVLVFAFLPFISGLLRGLCENRIESSGESIQGSCCQLCSRALLLPVLQYSLIPG